MLISETDRGGRTRNRVGALLATMLAAATALSAPAAAQAQDRVPPAAVTAAVGGDVGRIGRKVPPPPVLSEADAAAYRRIFELQRRGDWAGADALIERLGDDVLLGDVQAQRYWHPDYRTSYRELKAWMAANAEHPDAERLHRLALKRQPKGDTGLRAPVAARLGDGGIATGGGEASSWEAVEHGAGQHLGAAERRKLRSLTIRIRKLARGGKLDAAEQALRAPELQRLAEKTDIDALRAEIGAGHFVRGADAEALAVAEPAAIRSGDRIPQAHWIAGLAAWRSGDPLRARKHFEAVGNASGSPWMVAAGAYWAARANLVTRRPEVVNHWLEIAAAHPRTFYGLLARRALGLSIAFAWESAPFTDADADAVRRVPAGRRALALLQLGMRDEAEEALRRLSPRATPSLSRALLGLAGAAEMPELVVTLGGLVASRDGRYHDSAAFPVPNWQPAGGWSIDRALMLAFARQESGFDPRAESPAGAAGLMQLMPATARAVGGGKVSREQLFDPSYNLALGQAYIKHLLAHPTIKGNLFLLAAAYNSGPGNLDRWLRDMRHGDDPLLFIESIPSRETRGFVEKVMTNLWIYRARLNQPMASLDAVVSGDWPTYDELDQRKPKRRKLANRNGAPE